MSILVVSTSGKDAQNLYKICHLPTLQDPVDELKCDCDNMTVITMSPTPMGQDKTGTIVRSYGVDATAGSNVDISFYFDATVMALTGMT